MKTTSKILLAVGSIASSIPLFMRDSWMISDSLRGFLTGLGLSLMIGALVVARKHRNQRPTDIC